MIYDNGLGWEIVSGKCTVGIAPADELTGDDADPMFVLFVRNESQQEYLFKPENVWASADGKRYQVLGQRELKYLALEQRVSDRVSANIAGALAGVSIAMSGTTTTTVRTSYGNSIVAHTSDPGAASRGALIGADIASHGNDTAAANYDFAVAASRTFIATNTMMPGQYYGGLFQVSDYRRSSELDRIDIAVSVCGETKSYAFDAAKADAPKGSRSREASRDKINGARPW